MLLTSTRTERTTPSTAELERLFRIREIKNDKTKRSRVSEAMNPAKTDRAIRSGRLVLARGND